MKIKLKLHRIGSAPVPLLIRVRFLEHYRHKFITRKTLRQAVSVLIRGRSSLRTKGALPCRARSARRLDSNSGHPLAPLEQAPSRGPGPLELRMVLARSCCLTAVVDALVPLLNGSFPTLRERLRDWYKRADDKSGAPPRARRDDLLRPVAPVDPQGLALSPPGRGPGRDQPVRPPGRALDQYRLPRTAIPVAWKVLRGNVKHPGARMGGAVAVVPGQGTRIGPWWS